ncbi:GNAT family N-acetyltransferase [Saccharomonospora sp.]|uniref:GNAT family N-acetyltransferase n=1 Tax=Saccharomonospora sp. TaxID=33913 RepID=UPI00263446F4|nr:GNAT family N-acetyltransferase [Saccharomonospora sp.]
MSVSVTVLDPRRDPEPPEWSAFAEAARLHAPWDYGLLGLESRHAPHPTVLALATLDGRLAGAMAASVVRGPLGVRLVEVHNPWLSGFVGWTFLDEIGARGRKLLLRRMERELCRFAGLACAGVFYRYLSEEEVPLVSGFGRLGRETVGAAVLDNRFTTVDEWISSLARSRRHSLRGQVRKVERDPDIVVRFAAARDDLDGAELAELVNRHRTRFGNPGFDNRGPVVAEYLHRLVRRDDVLSLTYHDGQGRLLAFADLLDNPGVPLYQHWAALSKDEGGKQHLYFDSYARMMGHVVGNGREGLSAGRGKLELKQSLGLQPRRRWAAAVPRPVAG